ncbi:MAG TPA: CHAP domain-containing protein [Bacillota bacterium]|nr:CHAP domain-containing protein [Bacillota bacterium]
MEKIISNPDSQTVLTRLHAVQSLSFWRRVQKLFGRLSANRHVVRTALVVFNVVLLLTIGIFALRGTHTGLPLSQQAALGGGNKNTGEPLDQLSSADIAANASLATRLPETTAVINQADSAKADLGIAPADATVVAKPQAVATALKSNKDIKQYVVPSDDTVANIAAKFNVTSDSIMWSNNLSSSSIKGGTKLWIPPVNGIVYTVGGGDTIDSLASKYRANKDQLIAYNDAEISGIHQGEVILIPNGQLPAPVVTYRATTAVYSFNGYDYGFCTWYVANRRAAIGRPLPSNLGNANTWAVLAAGMGIATGSSPAVGAAAVKHSGAPGHVAIVEAVNADGSFWISEMNSSGQASMTDSSYRGGWGVVDWKLIPAELASTYSYVY